MGQAHSHSADVMNHVSNSGRSLLFHQLLTGNRSSFHVHSVVLATEPFALLFAIVLLTGRIVGSKLQIVKFQEQVFLANFRTISGHL